VLREGEALLLGLEGKAVIAASHFGFDSEGVTLMIYALGRHVECAGQGVGRALLGRTLEALHVTKVEEKLETPVLTRIWEGNTTSQRLFADAGFERIEETSKSGLFLWGHPLKA
jgi:ribosomal protein S18 acetylase RimI-like enzyme